MSCTWSVHVSALHIVPLQFSGSCFALNCWASASWPHWTNNRVCKHPSMKDITLTCANGGLRFSRRYAVMHASCRLDVWEILWLLTMASSKDNPIACTRLFSRALAWPFWDSVNSWPSFAWECSFCQVLSRFQTQALAQLFSASNLS